jgi:GxxExxY protein
MRESKSKTESAEVAEVTCVPTVLPANQLTELIIGAAIEVHRATGPGLMESVYEECLCYELSQRGLAFRRQVELPVAYKGIKLNCGLRMDLVVADAIVLELKTVDQLLPVHSAQLLTYLKLSGKKVGLLINFNEPVLAKGLKRIVNHFRDPGATPVTSAPSAFSEFAFLKSLRLSVSAVNKEMLKSIDNRFRKPGATPVTSAPSAFSDFAFLKTLRLSVSAVNQ